MKILLLAQFFPPISGGEERHVFNLAKYLSESGNNVTVATTAYDRIDEDPGPFDDNLPFRVFRFKNLPTSFNISLSDRTRPHALPISDPLIKRRLKQLLTTEHFDIIHGHNWFINSALNLGKRFKIPIVETMHDYSHVCATKRLINNGDLCSGPGLKCLKCSQRHFGSLSGPLITTLNAGQRHVRENTVSHFIAVSKFVAERNGIDSTDKYSVIPNFIPDDIIKTKWTQPKTNGILFVGDVAKDKGVQTLIEAMRLLREDDTFIPLTIIGRSVDISDLPDFVNRIQPLPSKDILREISNHVLLVAPSIYPDPCPTVILEAMSQQRPVVATHTGGIVDMIDSYKNGILVEPRSIKQLAFAIKEIFFNPSLARSMGESSLEKIQPFTASNVVARIEDVYRSLI